MTTFNICKKGLCLFFHTQGMRNPHTHQIFLFNYRTINNYYHFYVPLHMSVYMHLEAAMLSILISMGTNPCERLITTIHLIRVTLFTNIDNYINLAIPLSKCDHLNRSSQRYRNVDFLNVNILPKSVSIYSRTKRTKLSIQALLCRAIYTLHV